VYAAASVNPCNKTSLQWASKQYRKCKGLRPCGKNYPLKLNISSTNWFWRERNGRQTSKPAVQHQYQQKITHLNVLKHHYSCIWSQMIMSTLYTSRLHESASPALTAIHHSNARFCDFLLFIFQQDPWGSDPSTDRHAKWLKRCGFGQGCAFCSKSWNFLYHLTTSPQKPPKFGQFWSGFRKFSLDFALALAVSPVKTHKSSSEPPKSIIVNRQCGGGKSKCGVRFCIEGPCHVTSWPRKVKIVT